MTTELANRIYDVLVQHCGAPAVERDGFVYEFTQPEHTREWRFRGWLGFGGKFWDTGDKFYVGCYQEDETDDRRWIVKSTNAILALIFEEATAVAR